MLMPSPFRWPSCAQVVSEGADSAAGSRQEAGEQAPAGETSGGSGGLSISADDLEAEIELEADIDVDGKLGLANRERGILRQSNFQPITKTAGYRIRLRNLALLLRYAGLDLRLNRPRC